MGRRPGSLGEMWEMGGRVDQPDLDFGDREHERLPTLHLPPLCLQFCLGRRLLSFVGAEVPSVLSECWPCPVAASFLIRKPRGEEATCDLQAWPSLPAVCKVDAALTPTPHSCTPLSVSLIAPTAYCSPSSAGSFPRRQPSTFVCCCIFPHVTGPAQDSTRFWS